MNHTISLQFESVCKVRCHNFDCPYHSAKCGKSTATCELKNVYIGEDGKCGNRPERSDNSDDATLASFRKAMAHFSKAPDAIVGASREDCLKLRALRDDRRRLRRTIAEYCRGCVGRNCGICLLGTLRNKLNSLISK